MSTKADKSIDASVEKETKVETIRVEIVHEGYPVYDERFVSHLVNRLMSLKKIRVDEKELTKNINVILDKIAQINMLDEYDTILDNRPLSDYPVPGEFKDLVMPASVRFDSGDKRCENILWKPQNNGFLFPTYSDYINSIAYIRGIQKRSGDEDIVYVSSLRIDKTFTEVKDSISVKLGDYWKSNYDGSPYVPVPVTYGEGFFNGRVYFNTNSYEIIYDWLDLIHN